VAVPEAVTSRDIGQLLDRIVSRHEGLRVGFVPNTGPSPERDHQIAASARAASLVCGLHRREVVRTISATVTETAWLPVEASEAVNHVFESSWAEGTSPFVVSTAPLLRAHLVRSAPGGCLLFLIADRLVLDWHSFLEVSAEFFALGREQPRPKVVSGTSPWLAGPCWTRAAVAYWKGRWEHGKLQPIQCADLPVARLSSQLGPGPFSCVRVPLTRDLSERLRIASAGTSIPLDIFFMGALVGAVGHATQKTALSIWAEFRQPTQTVDHLGPFSHAHAVVVDVVDARTPGELLNSVWNAVRETSAQAGVSLELVWQASNRIWSSNTAQFSFKYGRVPKLSRASEQDRDGVWGAFDADPRLGFQVTALDDGDSHCVLVVYDRREVDEPSAHTLTEHLVNLLERLTSVGNPGTTDAALDLCNLREPPGTCFLCQHHRGGESDR
jgi:hypothetical protein